jgi:hypothetical protein
MPKKIDKARKLVAVWAVSANRLKRLSDRTGTTMVELFHEALQVLEEHYHAQEQATQTTVTGLGATRTVVGTYQDAAGQRQGLVSPAAAAEEQTH